MATQKITIGDRITNAVNKEGSPTEVITNVTFAQTSNNKTVATITTATQTIVKDVDLVTLSQDDANTVAANKWVVGQ